MSRVDRHDWGEMIWLLDDPERDLSLARMVLRPGATSPAHAHGNCEEAVHVLQGEVELRRGRDWSRLRAGDAAIVDRGAAHQLRNCGAGDAVMSIAYSAGARNYTPAEE